MPITLLLSSKPPRPPPTPPDADTAEDPHDTEPLAAVIVEDDFISLIAMESIAEEAGLEVVSTAINAEEARLEIARLRPDLVLMDINLGSDEDGIDIALDAYRRFGIRSLFTTAYSDEELKARAALAQPLGWVNKPFSSDVLKKAIQVARDQLGPRSS